MCSSNLGPLGEMNTHFQTLTNTVLQVFSRAAVLASLSMLFSTECPCCEYKSQDIVQESFRQWFTQDGLTESDELAHLANIKVLNIA